MCSAGLRLPQVPLRVAASTAPVCGHLGMMVALLLYGYSRGLYSLRQLAQPCEVQFSHVTVDGTKLKANASRHEAMSYGRMKTSEPALAAEVEAWLDREGKADVAEDGSGPGSARRRDAGLDGRQAAAAGNDPRRQGRAGGGSVRPA